MRIVSGAFSETPIYCHLILEFRVEFEQYRQNVEESYLFG